MNLNLLEHGHAATSRKRSYEQYRMDHNEQSIDRFIPNRTSDNQDGCSALDWPTKSSFNASSPLAQQLTCSLLDTTPEFIREKRILSFSSPVTYSKPETQNNINSFFSQKTVQIHPVTKPKQYAIEGLRVFDIPNVLPDFYANVFTWADTHLISIALDDGNGGKIFSMNLKDNSIGFSMGIQGQQAYSTAALGPSEIISGWSDGQIRTHALDTHACGTPYTRSVRVNHARILAIAPINATSAICGNYDGVLNYLDFRTPNAITTTFYVNDAPSPSDKISGLAYNGQFYLAGGTNSNTVKLWNIRKLTSTAVSTYTAHRAAIKGLAFRPDSDGSYLVSGGGTACRHICLWHIPTDTKKCMMDTFSQVSGVRWFKNDPRYLVTSHGYGDCSVKLWRVTSNKLSLLHSKKLTEQQSDRVLCLAGSPTTNEFAVATEKETLRFFKPHGIHEKAETILKSKSNLPPILGSHYDLFSQGR